MTVKLLTEHHLEFLNLKGGCTGSSESTLVRCHMVGNHVTAHMVNVLKFCTVVAYHKSLDKHGRPRSV